MLCNTRQLNNVLAQCYVVPLSHTALSDSMIDGTRIHTHKHTHSTKSQVDMHDRQEIVADAKREREKERETYSNSTRAVEYARLEQSKWQRATASCSCEIKSGPASHAHRSKAQEVQTERDDRVTSRKKPWKICAS